MKRFAQAAKELQIKKLAENIRMGNPPESVDGLENKDNNPNEDIRKDNEDQNVQLYKSEECEASNKSKSGLYNLTKSKHEGICYSCKYCGYKATSQSNLKRHQEAKHEGVKYSCNQCDYHATHKGDLKRHRFRISL